MHEAGDGEDRRSRIVVPQSSTPFKELEIGVPSCSNQPLEELDLKVPPPLEELELSHFLEELSRP